MSLEALGLTEEATAEDVKLRFRELAKAAHPDMGGSVEAFEQLTQHRDKALQEVGFGITIAQAKMRLSAIREAARGVKCPRCDGSGIGMSKSVPGSFKPFTTKCRLCNGKGKLS